MEKHGATAIPQVKFFQKQFEKIKRLPVHIGTAAIKTYMGAWITSERLQLERRVPCRFGCVGAKDNVAHYSEREAFCRAAPVMIKKILGRSVAIAEGLSTQRMGSCKIARLL